MLASVPDLGLYFKTACTIDLRKVTLPCVLGAMNHNAFTRQNKMGYLLLKMLLIFNIGFICASKK